MQSTMQTAPGSKASLWTGRILSALAVLLFAFTAMFSLLKPAAAMQGFAHYGYPESAFFPIAIAELACLILYAIPRTSVLGAILLTGTLLWELRSSIWAAPLFIVHGILLNFLYAGQHELSHWTVFRTAWPNEWLGRVFGLDRRAHV